MLEMNERRIPPGITVGQLRGALLLVVSLLAVASWFVTGIVDRQISSLRENGAWVRTDSERDFRQAVELGLSNLREGDQAMSVAIKEHEAKDDVKWDSFEGRLRVVELRQTDVMARLGSLERSRRNGSNDYTVPRNGGYIDLQALIEEYELKEVRR
jgi:hypothetical protein